MDNNLAFTSRIVPLSITDFNKITSKFDKKNFVDYPWTINEAAIGKDVFTKSICDCTCLVFTDGQKAGLIHLNPAKKINHIVVPVINFIKSGFNMYDKNLQAIVIGSKNTKPSQDIYQNLIGILSQFEIPFSILKNGKTPTHVAYRTDTDELLVSNLTISKALSKNMSSKNVISSAFEHIFISKVDEI